MKLEKNIELSKNRKLPKSTFGALNEFSVSQGYADFGFVVFGDNDEWSSTSGDGIDCVHSGLSFDVEVSLVEN